MLYRVKDPAILKSVKADDDVKFDLNYDAFGHTVTRIEKK